MKRIFGFFLMPAILIALTGCATESLMVDAAVSGDINKLKALLDKGAYVDEKVRLGENMGYTALTIASGRGYLEIVKMLVDKGANVDAVTYYGWTPLSLAANNGNTDIMKFLVDRGADIDYAIGALKDNQHGQVPIQVLRKFKEPRIVVQTTPTSKPFQYPSPIVKSDVDELPSIKAKPNKNAYAIVIGIENYRQKLPKADYAVADAKTMTEYLTKVMGYPEENVVTLINDRALKSDFEKYFEKWLFNNVEKDGFVFIYYSGHGAPNVKTGDAFLVPYDGDPSFIDQTGYSLKRLYENLGKLQAKEVIVALDSCFSGAGGRSVIAKGARPLVMTMESLAIPSKVAVISASSGDQISSTYEEKGHGLFTYFMLKGIKDGMIEIGELFDYMKPQVERVARKTYNNEQSPQLIAPEKKKVFLIEKTK